MTGNFLSFPLAFLISFILFSQVLIFTRGNVSFESENYLKHHELPKSKFIFKRSKSVFDDLEAKLSRKRESGWKEGSDFSTRKGLKELIDPTPRSSVEPDTLRKAPLNVIYIGCIATWENQKTRLRRDEQNPYDENETPNSCATKCQQMGSPIQVVLLKGAECRCAPIYEFDSKWINSEHCSVPCPVTSLGTDKARGRRRCGGNLGHSVYCITGGENDCNSLRTETISPEAISTSPLVETEINTVKVEVDSEVSPTWQLEEICTLCDVSSDGYCSITHSIPSNDYFPANSPEACIEFCQSTVTYLSDRVDDVKIREPAPYAALHFVKFGIWDIPTCRCLTREERYMYTPIDSANCNMKCPGETESTCGGKPIYLQSVYATIYCTNAAEECKVSEITTEPPNSREVNVTTTDTSSTPEDPCVYLGCDQDTEEPPTSSTTEETTTSDTTTETTTSTPVSSTRSTTTSTVSTISTTGMTTTTSQPTTKPVCQIKCQETDIHGYDWEACAGSTAFASCDKLIRKARGDASWVCREDGNFATEHPNVSSCTTPWVEERRRKVEEIGEIGHATTFMVELEEACRNAQRNDSNFKYFGHEITTITSLVDNVLIKVRELDKGTKFETFEDIIENAVNISALLLLYRSPWVYLSRKQKSRTSTNIIETCESALFNLTGEFNGSEYRQIFNLPNANENDIFKFLIFAETFDKLNSKFSDGYEFPPQDNRGRQDSFIKLPQDWQKNVGGDEKVEVAGMSLDGEYVGYIMPGQYQELTSSNELERELKPDSKLLNGKLISLTVTSSENKVALSSPRLAFTGGKGAEIVFYHDIEAWGDEKQDIPRKLHDNEKPKAVLGSTQCVYWDTNNNIWSSDGCRIIESTRFQTTCECNHLTSFAVLMDIHRYVGKQLALEILTLVLLPLSEIALVLCIIILSSINSLQKLRTTITKNLAGCLFIGNAMVLLVLDRNYFNMSEGLCVGAAMLTHYVFLCAFMWMLIEGVQLYRMVVHVFDSGKSYIKYFGLFAYGCPLIFVAITASTGYLQGDKPYGGDVYCWLEGYYIWSFMGPVAIVVMINLVILFIALKTAYQLQHTKKLSPTFFHGKMKSYKTWFKGCFSLTCILGLTWVVGFFQLMQAPSGIIAAYVFTILNASQGIFIFLFNCVLNEKVRIYTQRNLSVYLPSWLSSSTSNPAGNDASVNGKRHMSPGKTEASAISEKSRKRFSRDLTSSIASRKSYSIPKARLEVNQRQTFTVRQSETPKPTRVEFEDKINAPPEEDTVYRRESGGTISSEDSIPTSSASENGHISSDASQSALISAFRSKHK